MRTRGCQPVHYIKPAVQGANVSVSVSIDQYPFYRTAFDRAGLRYRGGYHTNTDESGNPGTVYTQPKLPTVGNIFAYGADPGATVVGGVESVRDNGDVDMYVQVIKKAHPKHGILRVTGLAFGQDIDSRTLLFYYGGTAGDGNTVKGVHVERARRPKDQDGR